MLRVTRWTKTEQERDRETEGQEDKRGEEESMKDNGQGDVENHEKTRREGKGGRCMREHEGKRAERCLRERKSKAKG